MRLSPDETLITRIGGLPINATIATTWAIMALLTVGAWLVTRRLTDETRISRWQHVLEVLVLGVRDQIREAGLSRPEPYVPFVGTLFVFLAAAALLTILPGYESPSSSLSTAAALAFAVFVAVPVFGLRRGGLRGYLAHFVEPTPLMLPFHVIGDLSRTLALAVRLFGNAMSGSMLIAILLTIAPFFFPVLMRLLELLTGIVQAYIFAVLATVYIAAASQVGGGAGGGHGPEGAVAPPGKASRKEALHDR